MKSIERVINGISNCLDFLAGWIFIGVMVLAVANVVLRAAFGSPIMGTFEYVGFYTALAIACSIAFCAVRDGHVAVTFIVERLFTRKIRKGISIGHHIISIAFFIFTAWKLAEYAAAMAARGELSVTTRTPHYPFIYITAFCFLILTLVMVTKLIGLLKDKEGKF